MCNWYQAYILCLRKYEILFISIIHSGILKYLFSKDEANFHQLRVKIVLCLWTTFPRGCSQQRNSFPHPYHGTYYTPSAVHAAAGKRRAQIDCVPCQEPCVVPGKYTRSLTYSSIGRYKAMSHRRVAHCFGECKEVMLPQFCRFLLSTKIILNDNI